jgi:2-haloacid dehalogenase
MNSMEKRTVNELACAPRPDTVVFDLGGVLIDWNPRHLYRKLFADEAAMERFLAEVCTAHWNERQDAGRPWAEAVAQLSAEHPAHASMIEAYWTRWAEMLGGPIAGTVAVLDALRGRGVRLYALTNWSQETFPLALERYPFLHDFEGIVVSGRERLVKPDPAIFRLLLSRFGIEAERAVYIDDAPRNVVAAGELGMRALQFRDPATLRGDLVALGLLDAGPEAAHG